jgi:hypothetical protein
VSANIEKQYEENVGTYKFHFEHVIKLANLIYIITGAILSFYFLYKVKLPFYGFTVLLLPIILNFGFWRLLSKSKSSIDILQEHVMELSKAGEGKYFFPNYKPLIYLVEIFVMSSLLVTIGLSVLFLYEFFNVVEGCTI